MEWIKKNKKIVIGVLIVVVISCIGLGAYLVSGNKEPKKANKENTEKTVEKQEDSEEVQDEEQAKENVNTETVVNDTTQTEKDEVAEETTETTQPSTSTSDTTSNGNSTTNNNTTSGNTTNSGSTTNNSNSGNTTSNGNSGSTANSGSTNNSGSTTGKPSDGMVNAMGTPLTPSQAAAVNAGYYKVATSSEGYSLVVPSHLEAEKGYDIMYDYLESLGYERAGAGAAYITDGYYGIYVNYENLHKIPTEDDIVWG